MPTLSKEVSFEAVSFRIVERLDSSFLRPVHAFGLTVGSRMLGFGELVLNAVLLWPVSVRY